MPAITLAVSMSVPLRSSAIFPLRVSTSVPINFAQLSMPPFLDVSEVNMLMADLMPVAATSASMPALTRVVPRAATCGMDCPMVVLRNEALLRKSKTCGSVAAKLSPIALTTLPRDRRFSVFISWPKAFRIFAPAVAACSALISKPTPIWAATSVNPASSSLAMPRDPPAWAISAKPDAATGMLVDMVRS